MKTLTKIVIVAAIMVMLIKIVTMRIAKTNKKLQSDKTLSIFPWTQ